MLKVVLAIVFVAVLLGCIQVHESRLLSERELRAKYWMQYGGE